MNDLREALIAWHEYACDCGNRDFDADIKRIDEICVKHGISLTAPTEQEYIEFFHQRLDEARNK